MGLEIQTFPTCQKEQGNNTTTILQVRFVRDQHAFLAHLDRCSVCDSREYSLL
jgi:hypothetical protein